MNFEKTGKKRETTTMGTQTAEPTKMEKEAKVDGNTECNGKGAEHINAKTNYKRNN